MKRYHVFTTEGRRIKWAPNASAARKAIEAHGLTVRRVVEQPNPLKDFAEMNRNAIALGSITTDKKAKASRENGKLGGRPKGKKDSQPRKAQKGSR